MNLPEFHTQHVFFASGSSDDILLFQQVITELPYLVHPSMAKGDEDTLKALDELSDIPDLIILDLDLRGKNGLEMPFGNQGKQEIRIFTSSCLWYHLLPGRY